MTLPQVPIPAGTPAVYRSTLDPSTGLYSHQCSKCGKFESTIYFGTGVFCLEHTPLPSELHYFNAPTRKDSPESLRPIPCSYLMGGRGSGKTWALYQSRSEAYKGMDFDEYIGFLQKNGYRLPRTIPATSTNPSLLKTLEKAVNTAKPMGAK